MTEANPRPSLPPITRRYRSGNLPEDADRRRLLDRVGELTDLDRMMREPGGLPSVPQPVPLCRARTRAIPAADSTVTNALSTPAINMLSDSATTLVAGEASR